MTTGTRIYLLTREQQLTIEALKFYAFECNHNADLQLAEGFEDSAQRDRTKAAAAMTLAEILEARLAAQMVPHGVAA